VFQNKVLRRLFEHKREAGKGGWKNMQNEEINKL
jgi:hypothetical protein